MIRHIAIYILFLLETALPSSAGFSVSAPSWSITRGMLKEKVTGIVQDERGFLWISTWGGLYRYDGRTFRLFKTHPGDGSTMSYNRLDAVKVDKHGNLWCRSFYHPYCFDVKTSTFIDVTEKLETATHQTFNINQIFPMASGYVWLQSDNDVAIRVGIDNPRESARLYSPCNGRLRKGKIISINEDSNGRAWILSEGGVSVPDLRVTFPEKRFDYWCETSQGCIYLATRKGTLWHLDTRTWKMRRLALPFPSEKILRLAGYRNGELVIATDKALLTFFRGTWGIHKYKEGYISSVKRIYRDNQGRYWMITDKPGVMLLESIKGKLEELNADKNGNYENRHDSWFFSEQPDSTVLLMSQHGGLCYYDIREKKLKHVDDNNGAWYQPQVGRTFVDREGDVWLYNTDGGLDRISRRKKIFRQWGVFSPVTALYCDTGRRLWVGDKRGKLTVWGKEYDLGTIYAIKEMNDGTMWVGTKDKGLYRLTPSGGNDFTVERFVHNPEDKYSISANDIFCMEKDGEGNLWVGTYSGGVNKVVVNGNANGKNENVRFLNKNNSLTWLPTDDRSLNIRSLLCTREGIMCVGTSHGIYAFKSPKQVFHHERRADDVHSLSNNEIMMMYQDRRGDVYCLTPSAGICRTKAEALLTDKAVFTVYDRQNLAPSDAPLSITGDAHDNLWIAYTNSVAMLNRERTVFYNWQSPAMSFAEIVSDGRGELIAATTDDIISWKPAVMKPDDAAPRIAIVALMVAGKSQTYDADLMDTIRFESNERDVSLQLSALTLKQGEKIKYAYRIDGDSTWVMQGDNDRLTFLNLRAGYHTIQVRSTNASGVWCHNERTITFYVTPTFWETPWALLLYVLIGALIIGTIAAIWAYIYRLRLKMRTQEEVIKERMDFIHNVAPLIREDKDDLLERVRRYIDEHISDENLTIPSIAAEMGMSRTSFFSRFKELAGLSPQDYLIHYRISHARELLLSSSLGIAEVAYRCGFSDPKYFSRVFKKIEGTSPSSVRQGQNT